MVSRYAETYAAWQRDPLNFWAEAAREIDWIQAPQNIFDAKAGVKREPDEVEQEIVTLVRDKIGPVAAFKIAIVVNRLPKTRSGKILRGTIKKIADGDAWTMPATIDDPAILTEIAAALQRRLSRAESILQELRNEVRNLAFAMWVERVQGGGSYFGDASSDWFTARNQLGVPPDLLL